MHLRTTLKEARGKRTVQDIHEASGVNEATIRQIEQGKLAPRDHQIEPLEKAYGIPVERWYSPRALLALQEGDEGA
jgi:transcriptional regulator with XRE-family HTH domain